MPNPYALRHVQLQSGERSVLLVETETGIPLFAATLYAVQNLRGRNLAENTIEAHLRAIMVLYLVLAIKGIDIEDRIAHGMVLEVDEVESVVSKCRLPLAELVKQYDERAKPIPKAKITSRESVRMR